MPVFELLPHELPPASLLVAEADLVMESEGKVVAAFAVEFTDEITEGK